MITAGDRIDSAGREGETAEFIMDSGKKKGCVPWIELGRKWIGIDKPLHRHPNSISLILSINIGNRK